MFRKVVFDKNIIKIQKKSGQTFLYEGSYEDDCFVPFPTSLIHSKEDEQALLSHHACNDASGYMDMALRKMLKGNVE